MNQLEKKFVHNVWEYWDKAGRHDLPWRKTTNPYRILVSEVMLQQTQVQRVIPKYQAFLQVFPTIKKFSQASLRDVLLVWQGLGYNRRAQALHEAAKAIIRSHQGRFPRTYDALIELPGVGSYTAGAIMAFAYNQPVACIETNIRTVYLHHFFLDQTDVTDKAILELVESTLPKKDVRTWYWALMDYGVHIKQKYGNQNHRAAGYVVQPRFVGSNRQIRGAIVRVLSEAALSKSALHKALSEFEAVRIDTELVKLCQEAMVTKIRSQFMLPK